MRAAVLPPGVRRAPDRPYDERDDERPGLHDRIATGLAEATLGRLRRAWRRRPVRPGAFVALVDSHDAALRAASESTLDARLAAVRAALRRRGFEPATVAEAFAVVREAAGRVMGQRHYATQVIAARALVQGRLVEMATGEGKTFAATLAAGTVALAGEPVHVITVNDYLAARDAATMRPLYERLGLQVGTVVQGLSRPERRAAYACDVTYASNKELAFDYLRDRAAVRDLGSPMRVALQRLAAAAPGAAHDLVLRGLSYAIVDEADSVFIDEARTPLILSASVDVAGEAEDSGVLLALAGRLVDGAHYTTDPFLRRIDLTDAGRDALADAAQDRPGWWTSTRAREERLVQALSALTLFHRDQHYVVADGKVQIVDESTGRVMPDRSWERGLHQLVEVKEGLPPTARRETIARLTYQRLMRRYLRLAGMSGTVIEVAAEIRAVYRLDVVRVPLAWPSRRLRLAPTVCGSAQQKWARVADVAEAMRARGRAVLIGTRSVAASEAVSAVLQARCLPHALLNAKHDGDEAAVIAAAGAPGRITVATNMAGRGTDIQLAPAVAAAGGLHVVLTEHHESARIDRQLYGRAARQQDPGSGEAIVSLDDELYRSCAPRTTVLARWLGAAGGRGIVARSAYRALTFWAQYEAERRSGRLRMQTMKMDERLSKVLAFSGRGE